MHTRSTGVFSNRPGSDLNVSAKAMITQLADSQCRSMCLFILFLQRLLLNESLSPSLPLFDISFLVFDQFTNRDGELGILRSDLADTS